jgi:hypothetical protein
MFDGFRSAMRNRQRLKWEKKRQHGKWSFLVLRGALRWGGIMFVLTMFTNFFGLHRRLHWDTSASLLIACLLIGYVWGLCIWHLNEGRFGYKAKQ